MQLHARPMTAPLLFTACMLQPAVTVACLLLACCNRGLPATAYHDHPTSPLPPLTAPACPQAPDGDVLCTCSAKKVQWYLQRGLAVAVPSSGSSGVADCSEPLSVQLLFEPLGRGHADDKYYLVSVCGGEGACYCHCWAGIGTLFVLCVLGRREGGGESWWPATAMLLPLPSWKSIFVV